MKGIYPRRFDKAELELLNSIIPCEQCDKPISDHVWITIEANGKIINCNISLSEYLLRK